MDSLIREVKYSLRSLLRDKGFAATVLLTLAVCIAANTATFAIVNSVVLRPLPVPEADQIVLMSNHYPKAGAGEMEFSSAGDYYDRLRAVPALREQALFDFDNEPLEVNGMPEQVSGMAVTPSLFPLLRVAPAHGRSFSETEGERGNEQKVILSDALWRTLYGGDLNAIGRQVRFGGRAYTIVGIMAPGFDFVDPKVRFWRPLAFTAEQKTAHHNNNWYNIGRLKPGATVAQVQAQLDALNAANLERFPQFKELLINAGFHSTAEPLQHMIVKDVERTLYLLWGGAIFVLLIGALNLANLGFARLTIRRKEMATKLALGGGRLQILRQSIVENVLIAVTGGGAGILLGMALLRGLAATGFDNFPRAAEVHSGGLVVVAALGMSAAVGVLMGLLPLIDGFNFDVNRVLRDDSRSGTSSVRTRRLRQVLVGAEIGFAFVLLAGAGLLFASFRNLLEVDPGFTRDGVLTASTMAPRSKYADDPALTGLMRRSLDAIRTLPGVISAGATTSIPFGSDHSDNVIFAEGYVTKPGESVISPSQVVVTPGYFETMRIGLASGRTFSDQDTATAQQAIIVDEKLARHFWPNQDAIGRRMYQPQDPNDLTHTDKNTRWLKVVGVVHSIRLTDLAGTGSPAGAYYVPYAQSPRHGFTLAIKTAAGPTSLAQALRAEIAKVDPELALFDMRTMVERAELSVSSRKTSMLLSLGFGGIALFLSAIGIYGVLAYLVTQRRREIGIRMALGSTPAEVVKLVMREGALLVAIGLTLGFAGTVALQKAMANQIYGVHPLDPTVLGCVILLMALIASAASAVPALRAVRVDPVTVLSEQ